MNKTTQGTEGQRPAGGAQPEPAGLDPEQAALVRGEAGNLLLDFLGERLVAERATARLYEALVAKLEPEGEAGARPEREDISELREQALERFHLLAATIERLGGDATALTPSAAVTSTVNGGLLQAMTDPRTSFTQGLKLMVGNGVVAKDAWETLVDVAERVGVHESAMELQHATDEAEENLASLRTWLRRALESDGDFDRDAPADQVGAAASP